MSQIFPLAVVGAMALFLIVLGYQTVADALTDRH